MRRVKVNQSKCCFNLYFRSLWGSDPKIWYLRSNVVLTYISDLLPKYGFWDLMSTMERVSGQLEVRQHVQRFVHPLSYYHHIIYYPIYLPILRSTYKDLRTSVNFSDVTLVCEDGQVAQISMNKPNNVNWNDICRLSSYENEQNELESNSVNRK